MAGKPDREYVEARRVLLDALVSLAPHAEALVLVGAQAVYLHVGEGDRGSPGRRDERRPKSSASGARPGGSAASPGA